MSPGTVLNTIDADANTVGRYRELLSFPLMAIGYAAGAMVAMWSVSPWISLAIPASALIIALFAAWTAGPVTRVSLKRRAAEADVAGLATDASQGIRTVKPRRGRNRGRAFSLGNGEGEAVDAHAPACGGLAGFCQVLRGVAVQPCHRGLERVDDAARGDHPGS